MYSIFSKEYVDIINKIDLEETNQERLKRNMMTGLAGLAGRLCVAKASVSYKTEANIYNLKGEDVAYDFNFFDVVSEAEQPIVCTFKRDGGDVNVTVRPVDGYIWHSDERETIEAIVKNLFIVYSRARMNMNLNQSKYTDMMTGLSNRAGLIYKGESPAYQNTLHYFCGVSFNIKNFKNVNRNYGVAMADEILKDYAKYVNEFIDDDTEILARFSGDNFFALIVKSRLEEFIKYTSECSFKATNLSGKRTVLPIDCRMGVYNAEEGDDITTILENASAAVVDGRAKDLDVNHYTYELQHRSVHDKMIMEQFPAALENGEIVAYYQPKVNIQTMEIAGCEALVRWFRDGKMVSPGEFLPVVERHNAMNTLDYYMLETACYDIENWLANGIEPVRISVNYSKQHLADSDLAAKTIEIVNRHGIDPKYIEIELTETTEYEDKEAMTAFVSAMAGAGIKVSMDDFGTGSSSLSLLLNLDFNVVKVDKSFVDHVGESEEETKDEIMIRNMVSMLKELNMEIVAEGVETIKQLEWMKEAKCDIVQGYIFDKPLPAAEFKERLITRKYEL